MTVLISTLLGGLGLLLIGMTLMTDGLKLAAGNTLRDILALWTNSRIRALCSGFLITGIVQSSSAVTVATIGFANAGMLSLERAVWVIYGSNVGTTMTAWIVALIGFNVNIEAFALPLIGLGALLKLTGAQSKRASLGMSLVGFGLLFLGISVLKSTFASIGNDFSFPAFEQVSLLSVCLYVLLGFILTSIMQSSSAAMVIALSAAEGGLIQLDAAAAVVIGANLGTTTTALIAVFGATSLAKRVAVSHVLFNVVTALVAIILLTPMLWMVALLENLFNLNASPAMSLAVFHSIFNVVGVLLMWPISNSMVAFLARRFTTTEEKESQPQHLDKNVMALPYIAIDSIGLELKRISGLTFSYMLACFDASKEITTPFIIRNLAKAVGSYAAELNRTSLTPFLAEAITSLIESLQEFMFVLELSTEISALQDIHLMSHNTELESEVSKFTRSVQNYLNLLANISLLEIDSEKSNYMQIEANYSQFKKVIMQQASYGNVQIDEMDKLLQYANAAKRASRHLWKAQRRLLSVQESLRRNAAGEVTPSSLPENSTLSLLQENNAILEEKIS
tara:strand:+ start:5466 stop:7160 length:1695 start_codon:yes stop_codon:yes gene_type:complete